MSSTVFDESRWYAVYTHPRQEDRTDANLQLWRVETFNPKLKERHYNQYSAKPVNLVKPLFPRYIFARFKAGQMLRSICYTRGVRSVVGFGDGPTPVSDEVIELIRSRVGEDGFVRINEECRAGDPVVIKDGPFKHLTGIFGREVSEGERVAILLDAVLYQCQVVVEKEYIKRAYQTGHCA
jgi:transcription elongation factor/antiterminator RfaH